MWISRYVKWYFQKVNKNNSNYFFPKRMRCIANLATFIILRTEPILHLWKHQSSRVQKEVLKHVLNAMEQSMKQKKWFPNTICIINPVWLVLIATKNLILPIFLMPVMDVSTVANAIPQSKYCLSQGFTLLGITLTTSNKKEC